MTDGYAIQAIQSVLNSTQAYKQFGNSVVVPLMTEVAKLVVGKLEELDDATVVSKAEGMVG